MMKFPLTAMALALFMFSASALAGSVADFETGFRDTYATYRTALFGTNSGDAHKSKRAIGDFGDRWRDLISENGSVPPPGRS
ncbi:hypothetical protein [Hoeflea sp.]|uniref:hypothetical protein n=1 Tax=Hoeflea sp. TaxID=1940281 RepID=UPI0019B6F385|nr:hypothetical protein [Hoeflea sp.]MBC7279827.1 hypothetical protein [Hoeflea sp.]